MNDQRSDARPSPGTHVVRSIPFKAPRVGRLSAKLLENHYEIHYGSCVRALNAAEREFAAGLHESSPVSDTARQRDVVLRSSTGKFLHEVYFDSIGEEGGDAIDPALSGLIARDFGSLEHWIADFTRLATTGSGESGWVVLIWSSSLERLLNVRINGSSGCPVDTTPVLALDLYEHAYLLDYGTDIPAYVDAFMSTLHWGRVMTRVSRAMSNTGTADNKRVLPVDAADERIDVRALNTLYEQADETPLVLDVRHADDRQRQGSRILDTPWRDSFHVSDWAGELPRDRPIVVYCAYGFWVSQDAAAELRSLGYDARSLEGGVCAWRAMGYASGAIDS